MLNEDGLNKARYRSGQHKQHSQAGVHSPHSRTGYAGLPDIKVPVEKTELPTFEIAIPMARAMGASKNKSERVVNAASQTVAPTKAFKKPHLR